MTRPRWEDLPDEQKPILPWSAFVIPAWCGFVIGIITGLVYRALT